MSTHGLGDVIVTSLFAYGLMAVIAFATAGFVAALVAGLAAIGRRAEAKAAAIASTSAAAREHHVPAAIEGLDPAIVAVITAAVQSVTGTHRIVYIGEAPATGGWTGEVRQAHHGSHHPHHER